MIRNTVENIKGKIAAFAMFWMFKSIDSILLTSRPKTAISCPQGGHEESMIADAIRIEMDEAIERRPAKFVNGIVLSVDAMK